MTKHQRVLLSGTSHCLWCGVVLGLLAADMYPGVVPAFSWTYIWGAMFLPPLAALLLCHVGWLGYSFIFWKWDYDFALFIREAVLPVVFLVWGACNFLIVPFIFLFILSPGGVE